MSKITLNVDTDSKECSLMFDGTPVDNLASFTLGVHGESKYVCMVSHFVNENGVQMRKIMDWGWEGDEMAASYKESAEPLSNVIKSVFNMNKR